MAPPPVHVTLAGLTALLVYLGATQSGACAAGLSLFLYGAAGLSISANLGLVPLVKTAIAAAVISAVVVIAGLVTLGNAGCSI